MSVLDARAGLLADWSPARPVPVAARPVRLMTVLALVVADLAAVVVATAVSASPLRSAALGLAVMVLLLPAGFYRPRLTLSVLEDLPLLAAATVAALGLRGLGTSVLGLPPAASAHVAALQLVLLLLPARALAYALLRTSRASGALARRAVVVGCGTAGARVVEALQAHPESGLRAVGFLDTQPLLPVDQRPAPVLGTLWDLPELVRSGRVDVVLVAYSEIPETAVLDVLRSHSGGRLDVLCVPRFFEVRRRRHGDERVGGMSFVRLDGATGALSTPTWRLKRALDVTVAATMLLLASPLMAAVALAVRLETGPGVLFRQERVGMHGRRFDLLKFRSLRPATCHEAATTWNIAADDRMGPVGRRIRRWSLDELPQLWNVLRGDMSLVGPRPERPHFVDQFSLEHEEYVWRHRVPVGLTGWAQVNGLRGDTSIRDRARYDNEYIQDWSLWFDVKVLLRTARQLLKGA